LADDATGALETGAKFAAQGIEAAVVFRSWPDSVEPPQAVVVDTETRHVEANAAASIVRCLAERAVGQRVPYIYKKTDSTIRGNIAAELDALAQVFGKPVLYAPAYPELGRTVRDGRLFVDGVPVTQTAFARDAQNPVHCDSVLELVRSIPSVTVRDASTVSDMEELACEAAARRCLAAGPGGFAGAWARHLPVERHFESTIPRCARCLVINGSMHPAAADQIRQAAIPVLAVNTATHKAIVRALDHEPWVTITTPAGAEAVPPLQTLAASARRVMPLIDGLVVFGGDTTISVLDALRIESVRSCGEVLPGVAASIFQHANRERLLVTKAGGFGGRDTLEQIRCLLTPAA
jgi:uncharacterized protein YgbK (DUF1537 family)